MLTDYKLKQYGLPFLLETNTLKEACILAARLGLSFVELNSNFPQCQPDDMNPRCLLELARTHDIFFTMHLDDALNIADFNRLVRKAYVETVHNAIRLAIEADIRVINIHLSKGNIVTLPDGKHYLFEEYPDFYHDMLRAFRDSCTSLIGGHELKICIENTDAWASYEQEGIDLMLESPAFGLTLDIGHDHAGGNIDLAYIEKHIDKLHHMHAHDGKGSINHQALGSGEIPLENRLRMAMERNATIVLETKTIEALHRSVEWLRAGNDPYKKI